MDKSVYNMKAEKIQKQVKQGDYETAAQICEGIDWTQVRSTRMLSLVSSVYEHVQQYDKAIDILLMAYEEAPVGRRFLYKLTELALASGNIKDAEEYYRNYLQEAADDNSRYILRYKIAETKHESLDKRITILEAYKAKEFDERWACRLAELCDEAGNGDRCVAICDEIILWFGVGPYVEKAYELKEKYVELTPEQQEKKRMLFGTAQEPDVASESGQAVGTLDTAVIENEQGVIEPENEKYNTRKIADKDDFNHTRIFEKLPMDEAEMQLFKTIPAAPVQEQPAVEPEENAADEQVQEAYQMEFDWDAESESKLVFMGADSPSVAMEMAAGKLKEVHQKYDEPMKKAVKITGSKLNSRGLIASLPLIDGRDIIVLGASALSDEILGEIKEALDRTDMVIILADSRENTDELEERYNNLKNDIKIAITNTEDQANIEEPQVEEEPEAEAVEEAEAEEEPEAETVEEPEVEEEAEAETVEEPETEEEPEAEAEPEVEAESEAEAVEEPEAEKEPELEAEPEVEIAFTETEKAEKEEKAVQAEPVSRTQPARPVADKNRKLSPEEFFAEVKDYMKKIDCVLEKGKDTELLDYFYKLNDEGEVLTAKLAGEMVEDAADAAESHSVANVFHSRYDDEGNLILKKKHFI